jgi:hypothetical protein
MELTTSREFRKHTVLGDIYAVEFIHDGDTRQIGGAKRCTLPVELTRGALPVLPLFGGDDAAFVAENAGEFAAWEPPMVNEEKLAAIVEAEEHCQKCQSAFETADKAAKAAKKLYEKACDDLRRVVRLASEPSKPLLAIAETPTPFDAEMENFDDHDGSPDAGGDDAAAQ